MFAWAASLFAEAPSTVDMDMMELESEQAGMSVEGEENAKEHWIVVGNVHDMIDRDDNVIAEYYEDFSFDHDEEHSDESECLDDEVIPPTPTIPPTIPSLSGLTIPALDQPLCWTSRVFAYYPKPASYYLRHPAPSHIFKKDPKFSISIGKTPHPHPLLIALRFRELRWRKLRRYNDQAARWRNSHPISHKPFGTSRSGIR
ncbi:uncharacterized protein SPPG_07064 [Spizellomyces punctatus DAOM BR117]|uniref:Uncharacterized protein n=1 Tax=Spizellomyces punctatus (strain DAOM BR117) TaxID=645134 RepID=A0A0L0H9L9_SPIPD|nr:uncharacterized protein SPPG_07064 [Spizellomyces punctatus DAOM BR117]KNC97594.1 hypothetical protein SPPG_07064 [Spizellomyces punctatus DAOM BR117]|eukprot:XP_016605634.1 hypothetical protein SPPG_07064 [Spizellomyces punctatus DAOM BR117]